MRNFFEIKLKYIFVETKRIVSELCAVKNPIIKNIHKIVVHKLLNLKENILRGGSQISLRDFMSRKTNPPSPTTS